MANGPLTYVKPITAAQGTVGATDSGFAPLLHVEEEAAQSYTAGQYRVPLMALDGSIFVNVSNTAAVSVTDIQSAPSDLLGFPSPKLANLTPSNNKDAGSATKANAKASTGVVYSFRVTNANAAVRYFQIHDKASAPAGTDTALRYFLIPAGTATQPAVLQLDPSYLASNINCSLGVSWAISTTATTFTDSATASDHTVDLNYL